MIFFLFFIFVSFIAILDRFVCFLLYAYMQSQNFLKVDLELKSNSDYFQCNRLEMETNVLCENNNAEMTQHETEINDLQKYLEKLIAEEKEVVIFLSNFLKQFVYRDFLQFFLTKLCSFIILKHKKIHSLNNRKRISAKKII